MSSGASRAVLLVISLLFGWRSKRLAKRGRDSRVCCSGMQTDVKWRQYCPYFVRFVHILWQTEADLLHRSGPPILCVHVVLMALLCDSSIQVTSFDRIFNATLTHTAIPSHVVVPSPKIRLFSFGVETLDIGCHFASFELAEALQRHHCIYADILLDCRNFNDPNKWALCRLGHSGRHHRIVEGLLAHPFFRVWLQSAKRRFQRRLLVAPSEQMTLGIYCRRGKHRSVAAALVLGYILQTEGFDCWTEHLASQYWPCAIGCKVCGNPPAALYRSFQQALEMWHQI